MSVLSIQLKRIARLGLILMMGAGMNADAGLFGHTMKWKEEVRLHDRQIIIAERFYNLGGYPTLESHNRSSIDETVTFNLPNSKSIVWKTDFRDSVPEPNSLNLILFDVVKGVPYIATYPAGCIAYNKWKRPNPPQILFKYEDGQWKRITLEEFPLALKEANVIVGKPDARKLKPFYTVEGVNSENRDIHEAAYKTILREAVPNYEKSCPVLVRIEGGWASPSGAKAPIPNKTK